MNRTENWRVIRWKTGMREESWEELIGEEPLTISVEGRPYSMLMRTPGEETFHAAGFCVSEGLVERPEDLASIDYSEEEAPDRVDVRLSSEGKERFFSLFKETEGAKVSRYGVSGKDLIEDLLRRLPPFEEDSFIDAGQAFEAPGSLRLYQGLHARTSSAHAMLLLDLHFRVLASAEDAGRHNALDKVIGKLFMENRLSEAHILVLSSRMSFEMVQKAARARLPILLSVSRPTALAVELADRLNMTLACTGKEPFLRVFCGEKRIRGSDR